MHAYYVSQSARSDGIHEIHRSGCSLIPVPRKRLYLGDFVSGAAAVSEARRHYAQVGGCEECTEPAASAARSGQATSIYSG